MSNFFYKFLSNPGNTIKVDKDDSVIYDILIKGIDKDSKEIIDLTNFCNVYRNSSFFNIKINGEANISSTVHLNNYNIGVYLIPTLSILNFSPSSLNELDRLYYQANHILNFLIEADKYCIKISELDNINNNIRYYDTKNNTYISANKIDNDIFLGYANNNILDSPNIDNGNSNTVLPIPDDLQEQILAIPDAQTWSDFFGTTQKEDIDDSHEKPISGTIKITDFGISNLSDSWIECIGQTLDKITYNNIYEAKKSLVNCNFPAFNSGVGYISSITNNISVIDIQKEEFVNAINTSQDLLYAKISTNQPIQILDAGYIITVNGIINFSPNDKIKIIINNTYVLHNTKFVGYRNGYSIIVCKDYDSYKTISKNNITITRIDLYGIENYSNTINVSFGTVVPDFNKTYLNISNYYAGIGIRFDDNINGNIQVSTLIKSGLRIDINGDIILPNIQDTLLSNNLHNICFSSSRKIIPEDLSFDNILSLSSNLNSKNYVHRKNILYKGFLFSDTMALNFQDPMPDFYVHLYSDTEHFKYGVATHQFLVPFYTMLALGLSLGLLGISLIITASAVITIIINASYSIQGGIYYTLFLKFINNNQQDVDVRQKSLQLYKMYIHE